MKSRRRFLVTLGTAAAAGGALVAGAVTFRSRFSRWLADRGDLGGGAIGPLKPETPRVLSAAAEALVGVPIEPSHYERIFRWRAEHLPGYREFYEHVASECTGSRRLTSGQRFQDLPITERKLILDGRPGLDLANRSRYLQVFVNTQTLKFQEHFVADVLRVFDATDAWIALGYEAWPGTPRGLGLYREPPLARPREGASS